MKEKEETEERERKEQTRRENEQIQSELRKRRQDATEFTAAMQERLDAIPEPLHLATCHTLSKVGSYLPLPSECASTSETLPIYQPYSNLAKMNATQPMVEYLAALLNTCMNEINDIELKHEEGEINDLELNEMSSLCRAIHETDPNALNVESLDTDLLLFDSHLERVCLLFNFKRYRFRLSRKSWPRFRVASKLTNRIFTQHCPLTATVRATGTRL